MFLTILAISLGLSQFGCRSSTVVKKLVANNAVNISKSQTKTIDGVMYNLPKTIVQVTVPVNKLTKTPGEFEEFAPCFFPESESKDRIKVKETTYSIGQPSFSSRGLADTSETYVIKTKGKYFESKSLFMEYGPGNVLQKGEAESKNETLEFTLKAISTAAGIAAKVAPLLLSTNPGENERRLQELGEEYQCFEKIKTDDAGALRAAAAALNISKGAVNSEMQSVDGVAPINMIALYQTRDEYRARYKTAKILFGKLTDLINQSDAALQNNGTNVPPDTYKVMREKNAEAIEAHRGLFLGLESKKVWPATFEFEPPKNTDESYSGLMFSYSKAKGVCRSGEIEKKSIKIDSGFTFTDDNKEECGNTTADKIQAVWIKVVKSDDQNYLDNLRDANGNAVNRDQARGWVYRVPANAAVTVQTQGIDCPPKIGAPGIKSCLIGSFGIAKPAGVNTITVAFVGSAAIAPLAVSSAQHAWIEMPIAQLGVILSLPASSAGRSSATAITLDPATGAMKNFKVSSSALIDKTILDEVQKAANSISDAADPLNKRKRELEELKTQNQINEEKKKLSNSSVINP
jgi:hypothetical protein